MPGEEPYVRGPYATMYTERPWTIRQYAGLSTASQSNAFYRQLLSSGAQGISVAFDLPTQRGYDSDHASVIGDVGKAGVAIDSVGDMQALFDQIPLGETSVSMTMNAAVLPVFASFLVAAERQGVSWHQLSGTIQNDILKEFLIRNTYIYSPDHSMRIVRDVMKFCVEHTPSINAISVSGYHMHEAGADAPLELAYALGNGRAYLQHAVDSGMDVDSIAPRMSFFFALGMNFYEEIAKLRAARAMWCNIVDSFKPKNLKSRILRMHCQTSGWTLTQQDPMNNIVRTTIEAMAGVFGGTQSMHTNSYDEAVSLPTETSSRIARNTQVILQEETGLTDVVDPWAGSYFMESLTSQMIERATALLDQVESFGGMIRAIGLGLPKLRIEEAAVAKQARIDRGEQTIVGVNRYCVETEQTSEITSIDALLVRRQQARRLTELKATRNEVEVRHHLSIIKGAAEKEHEDLMLPTINAMRAGATVGEVSFTLEQVWGRYVDQPILASGAYEEICREDNEWKSLKQNVAQFKNEFLTPPRILVSKLGQDGHDRGQRMVASSLKDLGFAITLAPLFQLPEDVINLAKVNAVDVIGISTLAGAHDGWIPDVVSLARTQLPNVAIVVGGIIPEKDEKRLHEQGVSAFFGPSTKIEKIAIKLLNLARKNRSP